MAAPPRGTLMRTASAEQVSLQHPSPGLESLQGAYIKNVERLEQSAEELSQGGSDIGDEIRRMKHEQDRASLRSSSMASSSLASREGRQQSIEKVLGSTQPQTQTQPRSRNHSVSSYANSIVDVNTQARWGGYSPGGYVTSPTASVSRVSSFHRPSGMPEPVQEGRPLDSPLASPTSYSSPRRQPSHYSLAPTIEDMEMLDDDGHHPDADKTPEPDHQEWEKASRGHTDPEEESQYSHDDKLAAYSQHDEQSHYSQPDEQSLYSRDQQSHYSQPDQQSHYSQPDQQSHYSQPDQQSHYSQDRPAQSSHYHSASQEEQWQQEARDLYQQAADQDDHQNDPHRPPTPPDRPQTADTYRDARSLFKDFDGVHYSPTVDEDGHTMRQPMSRMSHMSQNRMSRQPRPMSYAHPPPNESMVYYPAPVPRMLNLPKRLSQLPAANVQAQRRSQVLKTLPAQARQSAPWLPPLDLEQEDGSEGVPRSGPTSPQKQQRRSMMDLQTSRMSTANLPPQLRASVFFDTEGPKASTDVRIQDESAVATLDNILAASVNAPVNVFTDHPFAGPISQEIYASERNSKRRSATLNKLDQIMAENEQGGHSRSVSTGTIEAKPPMVKRNSVMTVLTDFGRSDGKKLKKRNSKMSLMTDLDLNDREDAATEAPKSRPASVHFGNLDVEQPSEHSPQPQYTIAHDDDDDDVAQGDEESVYNDEQDMKMPFFAQPTTLLAELQTRKAHQKSRNRTAADSFPNGMHSTLLQLDAVKQVEKNKRQKNRTKLAWEDPGLAAADQEFDEEDEDVPLGVLYPTKGGLVNRGKAAASDWDRPLGLMEKREFEDNEPLSSRRFRLKGVPPAEAAAIRQEMERQRREAALPPPEAVPLPGEDSDKEDEDPEEPLAVRMRRLRQKEMLNAALGDVAEADKRKSAFSEEVLSTFGGLGGEKENKPEQDEPEEETLGQRRARLQREREAQTKQRDASDPPSIRTVRPPLRSSPSLANLLAAHPVASITSGPRSNNGPSAGSLLAESARAEEEARRKLRERNAARSTSYNRLTSGMPPQQQQQQQYLAPQAPPLVTSRSTGAIPHVSQFYPQQPQPPIMYPAHMTTGAAQPYAFQQQAYLQPQAAYGYNPYQMQQQQMVPQQQQAFAHFAEMSARQNGMSVTDLSMDPQHRDLIDRWRMSIMH